MSKETLSISGKEVPKHREALQEKYEEKEPLNPENIEKQKSQLPVPSGWRLLVLPFTPKEKTKDPRLTLILFWSEISSGQTSLQRSEMEII